MARRKQRGALRPTAPMMANACSPRPGRLSPGAPARPRDSPAEPGRRSEAADTDCVSRAAGPYVASRNHRDLHSAGLGLAPRTMTGWVRRAAPQLRPLLPRPPPGALGVLIS